MLYMLGKFAVKRKSQSIIRILYIIVGYDLLKCIFSQVVLFTYRTLKNTYVDKEIKT